MKVMLATPLHNGSADREFIVGLLECHGLYASWVCLEGQSNISRARDLLVSQFLSSDCTTLVFIDGDVGFTRGHLRHLLESPYSVTSGLYPRKNNSGQWVCVPQPDTAPALPENPDYRAVRRAGGGFLRIDRSVFESMIAGGYVLDYPLDGQRTYQFFPSGVLAGEFLSEDYFFCELLGRAGCQVYIDTRIRLRHVGRFIYQNTSISSG